MQSGNLSPDDAYPDGVRTDANDTTPPRLSFTAFPPSRTRTTSSRSRPDGRRRYSATSSQEEGEEEDATPSEAVVDGNGGDGSRARSRERPSIGLSAPPLPIVPIATDFESTRLASFRISIPSTGGREVASAGPSAEPWKTVPAVIAAAVTAAAVGKGWKATGVTETAAATGGIARGHMGDVVKTTAAVATAAEQRRRMLTLISPEEKGRRRCPVCVGSG
mmetsp:Transcript_12519/g.26022  ORF Transcript_12519/g.26022 Transcript_12519/m.26022 type:complete len:220 (-) Transcript_12519:11-670(-)